MVSISTKKAGRTLAALGVLPPGRLWDMCCSALASSVDWIVVAGAGLEIDDGALTWHTQHAG